MTTANKKIGYLEKLALIGRDGRLTILSFMTFAFFWGVNDVIFNLYMIEAGFGEDFIGFFLSISLFVTAVCAIPAGMFTDRRSRKKILLGGNVIYLLAVALQYSTLSSILLIISQVLLGFSYSFVGVAWTPYTISVTTKEERIHLFSIRFAFFVIASFLGYLIGGFLPSLWTDFGFAIDLLSAYRLTLWFGLVPLVLGVVFIIPMSVDVSKNEEISRGLGNVKNWGFIGRVK